MCSPGKIVLAAACMVLGTALAPACYGQIQHPQPELLTRLWPLFRSTRPVVQLPEPQTSEPVERRRPLVAPYVPRKLDINSASFEEIQNLPGVTSSTAARIFAGRPYRDLDDLRSDGIPLGVVQGLADKVTFDP